MKLQSRTFLLTRLPDAVVPAPMQTTTLRIPAVFLAVMLAAPFVPAQDNVTPWRLSPELARFHLVIPEDASPLIQQAGADFQRLWRLSTRRTISKSPINEGMTNVWLGSRFIADDLISGDELAELHPGEFLVRTYTPARRDADRGARKQLLIAGGSDLAVLQGVFTFFGEELGVSWLEPGVEYAPKPPDGIREVDIRYQPEFSLREIGLLSRYKEGTREYRLANRLSAEPLCPPGNTGYFDAFASEAASPEPAENTVLYGSDEGAQRLFAEIRAAAATPALEANPVRDNCSWKAQGSVTWLVSAMTHLKPALSDEGRALNAAEGTPCAAILQTLNSATQMLEQAFPNESHFMHVLLSPSTQQPPRTLRPHPKVIIQVSTRNCDFARAFSDAASPANAEFSDALARWIRLGTRIQIHDFLTNQNDPLLPFPCLETLQANMLLFARKGVDGVYFAGTPEAYTGGIDLCAFRMFLAARLLFNPDAALEESATLFLAGYYGPAAQAVEQYLRILRNALETSGVVLKTEDTAEWIPDSTLDEAMAVLRSVLDTGLPEPYRGRVVSAGAGVDHCRAIRTRATEGP